MDPGTPLLLFALFQATEIIVKYSLGKTTDVLSVPIQEFLKDWAKQQIGQDDETKRRHAFNQAFAVAKLDFVKNASKPEVARQICAIFETPVPIDEANSYLLKQIEVELRKLGSLAEESDVEILTKFCLGLLKRQRQPLPSQADLADAIARFIFIFHNRLFAQPAYADYLLKKEQYQQLLHQSRTDTRSRYLAQIINRYQILDIPALDEQVLYLDKIFIDNLRVEIEDKKDKIETTHFQSEISKRRILINEALQKHRKLVVLAGPGAGKTTLLKYVTLTFAQNRSERLGLAEECLPIFVQLSDYVTKRASHPEGYSLVDYFYNQAHESYLHNLPANFFEMELERGRCCVCLDGLDELNGIRLRHDAITAISSLISRYHQNNRYLITSRIFGYEKALLEHSDFAHCIIQPFSDDDIRSFISKWYTAREKDSSLARQKIEHLAEIIMYDSHLKKSAVNPLLLAIIALVYESKTKLPEERGKLYDKFVTVLTKTWDEAKQLAVEDRERPYYKRFRELLEQLAYWMHTQPDSTGHVYTVKEGDLKLQISHFLLNTPLLQLDEVEAGQEAERFVTRVKARTSLLAEREGFYEFIVVVKNILNINNRTT